MVRVVLIRNTKTLPKPVLAVFGELGDIVRYFPGYGRPSFLLHRPCAQRQPSVPHAEPVRSREDVW